MKILTIDYKDDNAAKLFCESLKNTGFAVIKNHPIQEELLNNVYSDWDFFFKNCMKSKYTYKEGKDIKQSGYFSFGKEKAKNCEKADLKEFYQYYPKFDLPDEVSDQTKTLYKEIYSVANSLLEWLEAESPHNVFKYLREPLKDTIYGDNNSLLRIINYPPLTGKEELGAVRAAAHGDINWITILPASTEPGLQVMDTDGNWLDIECDPNSLVINTGDMISKATNGYYPSTIHRVLNPTNEDAMKKNRMSMPLFLHPRGDVRLTKSLLARDYLKKRLLEIGIL